MEKLNRFNISNNNDTIPQEIFDILSKNIHDILIKIPNEKLIDVEEIRLRKNKPLIISKNSKDYFVNHQGLIIQNLFKPYITTQEDIIKSYHLITDYSVYAFEQDIKNGFITIQGGHRIGICGRVILNKNDITTIQDISGLNIRIAREKIGVSNHIMKYIIRNSGDVYNTLIISPPQCGKTTLLRDLIRNCSNGISHLDYHGLKVGVVDERSEICSMYKGLAQNDVGIRTDVLDSCPKLQGVNMLLRTMSPDIIATDEIGSKEDIITIKNILNSGVRILTTIHGYGIDDILRKEFIGNLITKNVFDRIIVLSNTPKVGTIKEIVDTSNMKKLFRQCSASKGGQICL